MKRLIEDFNRRGIRPEYEFGRLVLYGGETAARENYSDQIKLNPEAEIKIILELAKTREDFYCLIEERAAIREADNLPGDFESAVRCCFL
ncbi:MAG: hypothetical protein IJP88_00185 [Synergistaceae bacterium]|nr:hypothetical protein [Synergistaceae bacterium]MBR0095584.1 hypothetical protein [Synergistaceae bacterium]